MLLKNKAARKYPAACIIICFAIVIGVVVVLLGSILIGSYNKMVTGKENVTTSYSNLDVMLERRADLIPNLVSTVKGYTSHENEVIDKITKARENLVNASNIDDKAKANDELTSSLNALLVVVENYPDLKSSANFTQLADELSGTENRIAVARRDYNNSVQEYNLLIKKFPNNLLAGLFRFNEEKYFEVDEQKKDVPNVSFD